MFSECILLHFFSLLSGVQSYDAVESHRTKYENYPKKKCQDKKLTKCSSAVIIRQQTLIGAIITCLHADKVTWLERDNDSLCSHFTSHSLLSTYYIQ